MTTKRQEKEEKQTQASIQQDSRSGSSTTTYHTEPGVSVSEWDLEIIRQQYNQVIGELNCVKAWDIERAIQNGIEVSAILDALEQTAMAPRPSHYYFRAIIVRYMQEGITTAEKAEAQREKRRNDRLMARIRKENTWYATPEDEIEDYVMRTYRKGGGTN